MEKNNKIEVKESEVKKHPSENDKCMKKECLCNKRLVKKVVFALLFLMIGGIIGSHLGFKKAMHHSKGHNSQYEQRSNRGGQQSQQLNKVYQIQR